MSSDSFHSQVTLMFPSIDAISAFKKECACVDFYIDRDALTLVGSFTKGQVDFARQKYQAQPVTVDR